MWKFTRVLVPESANCQKSKRERYGKGCLLFEDCLYNDRYFGCMGAVIYKKQNAVQISCLLMQIKVNRQCRSSRLSEQHAQKRESKYETESLTDSQAQEGFPTHQESIHLNNYSV